MEKLEIITNEMMADDGPMPLDLGNVSGYDTKSTQGDTSNDMSYEDVCAIAWKGYRQEGAEWVNTMASWTRI